MARGAIGSSGSSTMTLRAISLKRISMLRKLWSLLLVMIASSLVVTGALLQTWGTAARRHPVGGLGSIGEMLIEHNHGFGQGRGSNSECSFNQAHLPHDTWLQAPCLGLSFA